MKHGIVRTDGTEHVGQTRPGGPSRACCPHGWVRPESQEARPAGRKGRRSWLGRSGPQSRRWGRARAPRIGSWCLGLWVGELSWGARPSSYWLATQLARFFTLNRGTHPCTPRCGTAPPRAAPPPTRPSRASTNVHRRLRAHTHTPIRP